MRFIDRIGNDANASSPDPCTMTSSVEAVSRARNGTRRDTAAP
jgi:hypothetical protein